MVNRKHPLANCSECPLADAKVVQSHGPADATYAVVGEAPGRTEVAKGRPFSGPSGRLLDAVLADAGIDRKDVYTTNVVLCRPGKNDDPPPKAIECCKPRLEAEIDSLNSGQGPERILALGNYAAGCFLGHKTKITRDRLGPPRTAYGRQIVPSIHPAAILRSPDNFLTFVRDVNKLTAEIPEWNPPHYRVVDHPDDAVDVLASVTHPDQVKNEGPAYAVDIETTVEKDIAYEHPDKILCIGIALDRNGVIVIERNAIKDQRVRDMLTQFLYTNKIIYQNGKFDVSVLWEQGLVHDLDKSIWFDTLLASYCRDERPGHHSLSAQAQEILYSPDWKYVTKNYESFDEIPPPILDEYNAYDAANTYALFEHHLPRLDDQYQLHNMLCRISERLIPVERMGIRVDVEKLHKLDIEFETSLATKEAMLQQWVENPRSPKQVTVTLKERFGVYTPSTDKDHLTAIRDASDEDIELASFVDLMLEYRKESKLHGTYVKGLESRLVDGRIYPNITLNSTTTGRTSSKNPNLQNIPRGSTIRSVFIPDTQEYLWIYADYSNIEGRVVCVLSKDTDLQQLFLSGVKVHNIVAKEAFGETFTSEEYVAAKSVVHGVNYGRTAHGIAEGEGIPLSKAKKVYRTYLSMVPGLTAWHEEIRDRVLRKQEDLVTPFGRKRRFPLITRFNMEDVFKEAIAFQPQSIASDINTLAGCRLVELGYDVRLLVHDAVLIQVPRDSVDEYAKEIKEIMEQSAQETFMSYHPDFEMPFPVETQIGETWGDME